MADAVSHTFKPQTPLSSDPPNNPSKFYSNFLYKAALVTVFLVLLPLFPSIAPEFINQTLHARSWELLQLVFVGIAVSYGLFSKKNDETEKDHGGSKLDNAQSYVTKLLQVSSVFDDESEICQTIIEENNKVETLNTKYYRGEPVIVVAKQSPLVVVKQENGCEISQKPLLLPVRSLKQRIISEANELDLGDESGGRIGLISNRSRFTRKPRNMKVEGLSFQKLDENLEESVVLRSPIPWRSRSGRMEMQENEEEIDESTSFRSISCRLNSLSSKNLSTHKKLTPSTSFTSESQAKSSEDDEVMRMNNYFTSVLSKSNSSFTKNAVSPEKVVLRPSVPTEELSESDMEELPRSRIENDGLAKSVRTYETKFVEKKGYTYTMSNGKFPKEELIEMETSDEDDDYFKGIISPGNGEAAATDNNTSIGPDVDKKADEFIAKFREQIRLQRIESFRSSTAQRAGKTLR